MIEKYRFQFPIALMCRVLCVSPSGFYAARRRPSSARQRKDTRLSVAIAVSHQKSGKTYGSPRILRDLRSEVTG